jgi:hypothetical protein
MVRLLEQRSTDRRLTFSRHCLSVSIDPLDKADAPLIPKAYIYLLGVKCLFPLSDGLAGYTFPLYNTLAVQKRRVGSTEPVRAPGPLGPTALPETEPALAGLRTVRGLARAPCSPLLPPYLEPLDSIFGDVLDVLQTLVRAAGCLALPTT